MKLTLVQRNNFINEHLIPKLTEIGLCFDGKPISFNRFKKDADVHCYGTGTNKIYVIYFGNKENRFGFYPPRTTKKESLEISYQYYLTLFGDIDFNEFLYENVCWGNCGVPISYGKLRISENTFGW